MNHAAKEILQKYDALFEERKQCVLSSKDGIAVSGTAYYVSNEGNDENDGRTPLTAWKTLSRVSNAALERGDAVLFRRGDLFRGRVYAKSGVTYAAYGCGEKPKLYGSEFSLADPALWEEYDSEHRIWKCTEKVLDSGTLVFNEGEAHSVKLIPSYINGHFVCREDESKAFDMRNEMVRDLDMYWHFDAVLGVERPSKGKDFPIPIISEAHGDLYLRCDRGNPGEVFDSIESLSRTHMFCVGANDHVTVDDLCIKYVGMHGVSAGGHVVGLHVKNCEFGWIGGTIQTYLGLDPNYPEGDRGTVTRFGNAVEVYGGCEDYAVTDNYIYEVYDAGITHQMTTSKKITMTGIRYTGNVIEKCVYGIEYFLDQIKGEQESYMDDVVIKENFIRLSGYGWGQQRHNYHTPALIKGWSYKNTARNFVICNNIFDRCAYQMLHLVAQKDEYCAKLNGNTYIQNAGGMIGKLGGNETEEPSILIFDKDAESKINKTFKDQNAEVYIIENTAENK